MDVILFVVIILALALLAYLGYVVRMDARNEQISNNLGNGNICAMLNRKQTIIHYNKQLNQILVLTKLTTKSDFLMYNHLGEIVYHRVLEPLECQYNITLEYYFPKGKYKIKIKNPNKEIINDIVI